MKLSFPFCLWRIRTNLPFWLSLGGLTRWIVLVYESRASRRGKGGSKMEPDDLGGEFITVIPAFSSQAIFLVPSCS